MPSWGRYRVAERNCLGMQVKSALTDTVGWGSTPGQVGEAGPGGGALKQVTFLATEEHCASNLWGGRKLPSSLSIQRCFIPCHLTTHFPITQLLPTPVPAPATSFVHFSAWLNSIYPWRQPFCLFHQPLPKPRSQSNALRRSMLCCGGQMPDSESEDPGLRSSFYICSLGDSLPGTRSLSLPAPSVGPPALPRLQRSVVTLKCGDGFESIL